MIKSFLKIFWMGLCCAASFPLFAQGKIVFDCPELKIHFEKAIHTQDAREEDPGDQSNSYSYLAAYYSDPGKDDANMLIEMTFFTGIGISHWEQENNQPEWLSKDSLAFGMNYNPTPEYSYSNLQWYAKDFSYHITKYENKKGGIIEGIFEGTVQTYSYDLQKNATAHCSGSFQTINSKRAASECRKARKSELAVLLKIEDALNPIASKWAASNPDWDFQPGSFTEHVTVAVLGGMPRRPIFICAGGKGISISPKPNSNLANEIEQFSQKWSSGEVTGLEEIAKFQQHRKNLQPPSFDGSVNSPLFFLENPPGGKVPLKTEKITVEGVSLAYRFIYSTDIGGNQAENDTTYSLLFGNWNTLSLRNDSRGKYYEYKFKNTAVSPFVENVEITVTGDDKTVRRLINTTDWSAIKKALTE